MRCPRCQGLMRFEILYAESEKIECLLCLICGECIDPEIIRNRIESRKRIHRMTFYRDEFFGEMESTC